jgi:hypothetical protein
MSGSLKRVSLVLVWLLIAAVISIGAAGLIATLSNSPATAARPELTTDGDRAAQPGLDAAQAGLVGLTADVDRLGELGRGALTALVNSDFATLDSAVDDGQTLARAIETRSAEIRRQLIQLPGTGPNEDLTWSPETKRRRDVALQALDATGGLEAAWIRLAAGATTANRLTQLLTDHDRIAGEAAASGRAAKYSAALKTLAQAQAKLEEAKTLRDALANTVDVSTLTQWIDRNAEYDTALAKLYQATIDAKGRITDDLRQAAVDERRAHSLLPANTSGLVIILAEIGRGGLNQAVIGIEQTKARLQAAVDELSGPSGSDQPGGDDGPSTPPSVGPLAPAAGDSSAPAASDSPAPAASG